jgi:serine/threonine protein kinase
VGSNDASTNAPIELGGYRLVELLGRGGMGEVWRAEREGPGGIRRRAAVKRILPAMQSNPTLRERFLAEARINARLENPNIVQVLDFGDRPEPYLVLEFVEGITAADLLRELVASKQRLPVVAAAFVAAEAAAGLDYAHRKRDDDGRPLDIVHRDVSPQNILISLDGAVKISDFGVARAADNQFRTQHGMQIGKIGYMPPEQMNGQVIDSRADVFSLGVTLWELLTVQPMLPRDDTRAALEMLFNRGIQSPSQVDSRLPPSVDAVVMPAISVDPAQRYSSAGAFAQALRSFVHSLAPGFDSNQLIKILSKLMPAVRWHVPTNTLAPAAPAPNALSSSPNLPPTVALSASSPHLPSPAGMPAPSGPYAAAAGKAALAQSGAHGVARAEMPAIPLPTALAGSSPAQRANGGRQPQVAKPQFPNQPEMSLAPLPQSNPWPVLIGIAAVVVVGGIIAAVTMTRGSGGAQNAQATVATNVPQPPRLPLAQATLASPNVIDAGIVVTPLPSPVVPQSPATPTNATGPVAPIVAPQTNPSAPPLVAPPPSPNGGLRVPTANGSANTAAGSNANAPRAPHASAGNDPVRAISRQVQAELQPLRPLIRACLGVPEGSGARVTLGIHYVPATASVASIEMSTENAVVGPNEQRCIDSTVRGAVNVRDPAGGPLVIWYVYEY